MKKQKLWLMAALLVGTSMVAFPSCGDDDDDDNNGGNTQTNTLTKPVEGTDFTVATEGNTVTISSALSYGTMYVLYDGTQYNLKDGKVAITIPIAGEYKMTFNIYDAGSTATSDEFTVTIASSDLTFLDEGVFKLLSGGQAAYEEAAKTADENGVFTRTWRLDGFLNNSGVSYSKVFAGPGTYCLESENACYNGGVSVTGSGAWRDLGAMEDATISFDMVNKKVKVVFTDGVKLQEATVPNGVHKEEALTGTYYGTFTYSDTEMAADFKTVIDGWALTATTVAGIEINMTGDNVRVPFLKSALGWPLPKPADLTTVKLYASKSAEEQEDGLMILTAVSYNTDAENGETAIKDDYCNIMLTYVAEELDDTYKYTVPAEEVAGEWESHIAFWGNNNWDAEGIATVDQVTVKGDGEYTYTATINAESTKIEYFCIHFDSPNSYAAFTAEGV
nr:hypothetical protein [Bacteroidales bacterium]